VRDQFDRRVVPEAQLEFLRECQARVSCELGGGAALSGAYLAHRLSRDLDLVCHSTADVRSLARELPLAAQHVGAELRIVQDAGTFVRAWARIDGAEIEVDVVFEGTPDLEPPPPEVHSGI
jgi:hypothetical protein